MGITFCAAPADAAPTVAGLVTFLADRAIGWRHGIVTAADAVPLTMADLPVANWSATSYPGQTGPSAGGASIDADEARTAAIAEAVERIAATMCPLPPVAADGSDSTYSVEQFTLHSVGQRRVTGFPYAEAYRSDQPLTRVFRAADNRPALVPISLLTLDPERSVLATSSGLAADPSPRRAVLRAIQELVERDALMITWLHGVAADRVPLPEHLSKPVEDRGGDVVCFNLTPAYSPHPVAAVAGDVPMRGSPRLSLGVACRARWADAVEKAWVEWAQGTTFVAMARSWYADMTLEAADVTGFDQHAVYYSLHPEQWAELPIFDGRDASAAPDAPVTGRPADELAHLVTTLAAAGIDVFYRDLTTIDAAQVGLRVVRALAPALVSVHGNHNWPYLGGTAADLGFRYPSVRTGCAFPNPAPHPLG